MELNFILVSFHVCKAHDYFYTGWSPDMQGISPRHLFGVKAKLVRMSEGVADDVAKEVRPHRHCCWLPRCRWPSLLQKRCVTRPQEMRTNDEPVPRWWLPVCVRGQGGPVRGGNRLLCGWSVRQVRCPRPRVGASLLVWIRCSGVFLFFFA